MASGQQLTALHRRQQLALRQATVRDLARLWPALDWARLDATYPRFAASVAVLVGDRRRTSAGLAAAYLRAFRVASGVPGDLRIVAPELAADKLETSLRVTSIVALKKAAERGGTTADTAMRNALTQTSGAVSRLVLDAARETVTETVAADPAAAGWQRVIGGGSCDFCYMLASRGDVYSAGSANFASHDHCGCSVAPVYETGLGAAKGVKDYEKSAREVNPADRERVREWMKRNPRNT